MGTLPNHVEKTARFVDGEKYIESCHVLGVMVFSGLESSSTQERGSGGKQRIPKREGDWKGRAPNLGPKVFPPQKKTFQTRDVELPFL